MKIKDFLENFNSTNHIKICDRSDFSTHRFNNPKEAIEKFGYFTVKSWEIAENVLIITIQSQF